MRTLLVGVACLGLVSIAACGKSSPTAPTTPPTPSTTRVIGLSGNLAFGNVTVGTKATGTLLISNSGNGMLTVTGVRCQISGLTASWQSGTIAPGGTQNVSITFSPVSAAAYSATLFVDSDSTSGTNGIPVSGTGVNAGPSTYSVSGTVTDGTSGGVLPGISVSITDGANAGKSATTSSSGGYSIGSVSPGSLTMSFSAGGYQTGTKTVSVSGNTRVDFVLQRVAGPPPPPPGPPPAAWSRSGVGDNVFDMPSSVARVHITGRYTGYSSNFIVYIGGHLVVNELLGTGWDTTTYDGVLLSGGGGVVEIKYSSGVSWSFTEVR